MPPEDENEQGRGNEQGLENQHGTGNDYNEHSRDRKTLISLGQRIRELRLAKGMTQDELAKGIVSGPMISQIENGVCLPSHITITHLATRLGTSVDSLYEGLTFSKKQMAGYKHALSQMAVGYYIPAMHVLEEFYNSELLHFEIHRDELKLNLAVCYREANRFEDAVLLYEELLQELSLDAGRKKNFRMLVNTHMELSETYERMGRYFEALRSAMNARDVYAKHKNPDPFVKGKILLHLADLNQSLHRIEEAQTCYEQALAVYDQLSDDLDSVGMIYQRLAEVYTHQQNAEMAIEFSNKAIVALQAAGLVVDFREAKRLLVKQQVNAENWEDSVSVLLNLAMIYSKNDVTKQAETYLDVAEIYLPYGDPEESLKYCLMTLSLLAKRYSENILVGRANLILGGVFQQKGEADRAVQSLEISINVFKQHEKIHELDLASRQLCTLLRKNGENEKALDVFDDTHNFIFELLRQRGVAL